VESPDPGKNKNLRVATSSGPPPLGGGGSHKWSGPANGLCLLCAVPEDTRHIMFSCPAARLLWRGIVSERLSVKVMDYLDKCLRPCAGDRWTGLQLLEHPTLA
jgi:hypothetical protein